MSGYYIDYAPLTPQIAFTQYQKRSSRKYNNDGEYEIRREIFDAAKKDPRFKVWKKEQLENCQNHKCPWCNNEITLKGSHVDHIEPLRYYGSNRSYNLVVACKDCNKKKLADRFGWNARHRFSERNSKPSRFSNNQYDGVLDDLMAEYEAKFVRS